METTGSNLGARTQNDYAMLKRQLKGTVNGHSFNV